MSVQTYSHLGVSDIFQDGKRCDIMDTSGDLFNATRENKCSYLHWRIYIAFNKSALERIRLHDEDQLQILGSLGLDFLPRASMAL